ncbi:potassium-transporting ATPase subunit KdpC [Lysinibacter sp. HNR]|uniref:potassium-transporting ATPase subunit KdpC n=1 Tax=Lysinibacter sp. HNR TaxID=3031408 RepID=UPI002434F571|nr:potassium-transporting ATPase subunit KdpC [Lysinibacter sp. HNR]WGD37950.1 potassium-transporting ATPase subunit KdpC [Lysinibacter sp. HNR]
MSASRSNFKQYTVALRVLLIFTVILGIGYPLVMTAASQLLFPAQANGSLVHNNTRVVGSSLLGQAFTDSLGNPSPEWFQPRPSVVDHNAASSGGSNLGSNNSELVDSIERLRTTLARENGVSPEKIPADALTASASGLDPHISPDYALLQVNRVSEARGLAASDVRALVESFIQPRDLGFLGESTVNVLELNIALHNLSPDDTDD